MGIEVKEVRASGGGGRYSLWRQMQADMFNKELRHLTKKINKSIFLKI